MKHLAAILCLVVLTGCTVMRDQLGYEPTWPAVTKGN